MILAEGMGSFVLPYPNLPEAETLALLGDSPKFSFTLGPQQVSAQPHFQKTPQILQLAWAFGTCNFSLTQASRVEFRIRWCQKFYLQVLLFRETQPWSCSCDQNPGALPLCPLRKLSFSFSQNLSCHCSHRTMNSLKAGTNLPLGARHLVQYLMPVGYLDA